MFHLKNTTLLKCAVVALLAFASCSKDDTKGPETPVDPEIPAGPDTLYQVQAIYWGDNIAYDSFVYKNNQLVESWLWAEDELAYMQMSKYTYNADGLAIKAETFQKYRSATMYLTRVDSLAWSGSSIINYRSTYYENSPEIANLDTIPVTLDAAKRVTQVGSKDTVRSEYSKRVSYLEFQLTGGNITKRMNKNYYISLAPDAEAQDVVETTTVEYGDLVNPLQEVLIKNPILALNLEGYMDVSFLSSNNPTKISYVGKEVTEEATVTCQALPGTKVLYKSTYKVNGDTRTMHYGINKIVK